MNQFKSITNPTKLSSMLLAAMFVVGCGSSNNDPGTLSLDITDAPVDGATEVVVIFNAIELNPKQGDNITITFDTPQSIDLLALQNGVTAPLLQNQLLTAGEYNWMRLAVDADEGELDSYISFEDGSTHSLYVPSGSTSGLKINRPFTIPQGGSANFTIDFDLRKSIHLPGNSGNDYKLRPTLRITDNTEVGKISGFIAASVVADESCTEGLAIYAYNGSSVIADDEGSPTSPLTSAIPEYNNTDGNYYYQLSFMLAGDYTLAVTCDAEFDEAETDEDVSIWTSLVSANVSVSVDQTSELNFE